MAVKDEETEADVLKIVELLSSPHDQLLARLDLFLLLASSVTLHPGPVLHPGAGPAGHVHVQSSSVNLLPGHVLQLGAGPAGYVHVQSSPVNLYPGYVLQPARIKGLYVP